MNTNDVTSEIKLYVENRLSKLDYDCLQIIECEFR